MPRGQPDTDLIALALETRVSQETPQPAAAPHSPPAEAENAEPSPQAQPETRRRKRPRDQSSQRESRGKEQKSRGKEPENTSYPAWQPTFSIRGEPVTEGMSLEDDTRLAVELSSALLLPKDVEAANKIERRKLTRSAIHLQALALQRSYIALSNLEAEVRDAEAVKQQNAELLLDLNKSKITLIEADDARKAAETARREAEDETLAVRSHATELEQLLADRERELAEMKLKQQEKEDEAYNEGLNHASEVYKKQVLELRGVLFAKGWTSAMTKAGIQEGSSLFIVENPYSQPAAAPPSPPASPSPAASPSHSDEQDPPASLE